MESVPYPRWSHQARRRASSDATSCSSTSLSLLTIAGLPAEGSGKTSRRPPNPGRARYTTPPVTLGCWSGQDDVFLTSKSVKVTTVLAPDSPWTNMPLTHPSLGRAWLSVVSATWMPLTNITSRVESPSGWVAQIPTTVAGCVPAATGADPSLIRSVGFLPWRWWRKISHRPSFVIYQGALDVKSAGRVFPGSFAPRRGVASFFRRDKVGRSRPAVGRP